MPQLHAQPYDISANGFYFESLEDFADKAKSNRNDYGDPVEEYEIQFIDGNHIDCDLAKAWGINQANIGQYFDACESWDDQEKPCLLTPLARQDAALIPTAFHQWILMLKSITWTAGRSWPSSLLMKACLATSLIIFPTTLTRTPSPVIWRWITQQPKLQVNG